MRIGLCTTEEALCVSESPESKKHPHPTPLPTVWTQLKLPAMVGMGGFRKGLLGASIQGVQCVKTYLEFIHFSLCILQKALLGGKQDCFAILRC